MAGRPLKVFVSARSVEDTPETLPARLAPRLNGDAARQAYEAVLALPPVDTASPARSTASQQPPAKRRRLTPRKPTTNRLPADAAALGRQAFLAVEANEHARLGQLEAQGLVVAEARDAFGWTLLMSACAQGNEGMARALLAGPSTTPDWVAVVDSSGRSARDIALRQGHHNVLALLDAWLQAADVARAASLVDNTGVVAKGIEIEPEGFGTDPKGSTAASALVEKGFCAVCQAERLSTQDSHEQSIPHLVACQHPVAHRQFVLSEANRGFQIMRHLGWRETGLGPRQAGRLLPIKTTLRRDRTGVGAVTTSRTKPRVTHYRPHDIAAVAGVTPEPKVTKKDLIKELSRDRRKEQKLRAYLNAPDHL